ncbi:MAG TPA: hypothetical protein VMW58_07925 [Anaerolineae bacterium]|nr:hypothetical protein [Anaerolineae bacterium]
MGATGPPPGGDSYPQQGIDPRYAPEPEDERVHACPVCGFMHKPPKAPQSPSFLEDLWGTVTGRGK